jgi:hypothetical protein
MEELGGHVVSLAEHDAAITFNSGLDEKIRTILYLPVLQITAFYRSLAKGLNPDKPNISVQLSILINPTVFLEGGVRNKYFHRQSNINHITIYC